MKANIDIGYRVNVKATVMKGDEVVREYPMEHNLVLDSGLEILATKYTSDTFVTAALGNGTAVTERGSGGVTVSATGGTATASAGFFTNSPTDVGKVIKFTSTGEVARITGFTSTTQVTISITDVIAGQVVNVYNVNQTQLDSYVTGSETYRDTGNAENGSNGVITDGVDWVMKRWRTFQFAVETGSVTYTEGGWTWEAVAVTNPTLFGRILFTNAINLEAGEFLLMYVELKTTVDCTVKTIGTLPITNLGVAAKSTVRPDSPYDYMDNILATGASNHGEIGSSKSGVSEPLNSSAAGAVYPATPTVFIAISNVSTAITSDPEILTGTWARVEIAPATYVASSYQFVFTAFFTGVSVDLTNDWYDIRFNNDGGDGRSCFRILFDSVQSKTATDTVQLVFTKSWNRDLS